MLLGRWHVGCMDCPKPPPLDASVPTQEPPAAPGVTGTLGETAKAWALVSRGRLSCLPRRAELPRGSESKGHETWCWAPALG